MLMSPGSTWKPYINAIALGDPQQTTYSDLHMSTISDPESFTSFLANRCRAYVLSEKPVGTPEFGRYRDHGCNCYSSGEPLNTECIMASAWPDMVAWLDVLWKDPKFHETLVLRAEDIEDDARQELETQAQVENETLVSGIEEELASVSLDDTKPTEEVKAGDSEAKEHPLRTVTCVDEKDEPEYAKA